MVPITLSFHVSHVGQCLHIQDALATVQASAVRGPSEGLASIGVASANAAVGTPLLGDVWDNGAWSRVRDTSERGTARLACLSA